MHVFSEVKAVMELISGWFGDKLEYVAGAMVLVQATATYMAGIGAANTLVTAPLVFAAVGFVPLAVVGISDAGVRMLQWLLVSQPNVSLLPSRARGRRPRC